MSQFLYLKTDDSEKHCVNKMLQKKNIELRQ